MESSGIVSHRNAPDLCNLPCSEQPFLQNCGRHLPPADNRGQHHFQQDVYKRQIIQRDEILETLENFEIMQIRRIKAGEVNTRNSVLFFNIISETKNMLLHSINLIKAHRDFILESQQMAKKKGY